MEPLTIAGRTFTSRLFLGTGKFGSLETMQRAVEASESELVTVALRRITGSGDETITLLKELKHVSLLPNTSGARDAKEALFAAKLAREALNTEWIKLEIHPDPHYLLPDGVETLKAAEELVREGFIVLPYIHADPVLCKRLEDVGVQAVMPLGAPIGTNRGIEMRPMLEIIIEQSTVPVIVDAGLGAPSHAALALEMGASAVLINTAIATAGDPVAMAKAFRIAVESGRMAFEAAPPQQQRYAIPTSPLEGLF